MKRVLSFSGNKVTIKKGTHKITIPLSAVENFLEEPEPPHIGAQFNGKTPVSKTVISL